MPRAFDLHQYVANLSPALQGVFVDVQDIMGATAQMWAEVLQILLDEFETLFGRFVDLMDRIFVGLLQALIPYVGPLGPFLEAWVTLIPVLGGLLKTVIQTLLPMIVGLLVPQASETDTLDEIISTFWNIVPSVASMVEMALPTVLNALINTSGPFAPLLRQFVNAAEYLEADLVDFVMALVQPLLNALFPGAGTVAIDIAALLKEGLQVPTGQWLQLVGMTLPYLVQMLFPTAGSVTNFLDGLTATVGFDITGGTSTVQTALKGIPGTVVLGQWAGSIQDDMALFQSGVSTAVTDATNTIPGLKQCLSGIASLLGYSAGGSPPLSSTTGIARTSAEFISQQAVSKPLSTGVDQTIDAVFDLTVLSGTTPTTIPVTSANSVLGYLSTEHGGIKESIVLFGYPTGGNYTNISSLTLNVYYVDNNTGAHTEVYTMGNCVGLMAGGTTPVRNYVNIPALSYLNTAQGNCYGVELVIAGSGTYNIVGLLNWWMQNHVTPGIYPKNLGAVGPISGGQPSAYVNNVPWFGLSGSAGVTLYPPETTTFPVPGTFDFDPTKFQWADYFDLIGCSGAGPGGNGAPLRGGTPGGPGTWQTTTITKTQAGTALWTVSVGSQGMATRIIVPGFGTPIDVGGGGNGSAGSAGSIYGMAGYGPGDEVYTGYDGIEETYYGGNGGAAGQGWGTQPGGSGGGGNSIVLCGYDIYGGGGAPGVAYIRAYKVVP